MDMNSIIIAAVVIAAVGIIVGVGLGLFGAKFKVEVDEKRQLFVKSCQATTAVAVVTRAVMVLQRPSQRAKLRSMPARSAVLRLARRSLLSWV